MVEHPNSLNVQKELENIVRQQIENLEFEYVSACDVMFLSFGFSARNGFGRNQHVGRVTI